MLGDIVLYRFPFTSDAAADVVVCRVTSVVRSGPLDVPPADWRAAGLTKPSVVRLDRLATVERTIIVRQLGSLTPADLATIRSAWNRHMRL